MPGSRPFPAQGRTLTFWVLAATVPFQTRAGTSVSTESSRLGLGVSRMAEMHSGSLLLDYFKAFLGDRDLEGFRNRVVARYSEGTLGRILSGSDDVAAPRRGSLAGVDRHL